MRAPSQALNFPELHEDSIPELAYMRAADKMMKICGIMDFGLRDVTNPNNKRLRRQLSGIINFAKFREERLQMYGELNLNREELGEKLKQMQEDNNELNRELDQLKQQSEGEMEIILAVEEECKEIEIKIGALNKQQAAIRHESGELKKKANDLKDRNATISLAIQEGAAEEKKLTGQVVSSPERVRKEMSNATERLDAERKESLELERDAVKMKAASESSQRVAKDVTKTLTEVDATVTIEETLRSSTEEIKITHAAIDEKAEQEMETAAVIAGHERVVTKYTEKCEFLKKNAGLKQQAAETALLSAQQMLLKSEKDRRDCSATITQVETEARAELRATGEEESRLNAETENMIKEYMKMEKVVILHQQNLMQQLVV